MRRFIIDTDTASDDAVALVMALRYPGIRVEAITLVGGNVPVDQGVQNALYTQELCSTSVPVYRGAAVPLLRPLETAQSVHGTDGMGDIGLPVSGREPALGHAVDVLLEIINGSPGEITLVTLGPLTNIAIAVLRDPSIAHKVSRCVIMGGTGQGHGNVTPVAEYNIWTDPEAAKIVFESGLPITMVGWDISWKYAVFNAAESAQLRAVGTPLAQFCVDIQGVLNTFALQETQLDGFDLPDPITMAVALEPEVAVTHKLHVAVEVGNGLCRGQTIVDHLSVTKQPPNIEVVMSASRDHFLKLLYDAVSA
jgi:purine nucleosidase